MWEKVARRSHKPAKVFPFGSGSNDVMLYGTVDYELKDGKGTSVDWAARAHFVEEAGSLKMDFYQVYLVCQCLLFLRLQSDRFTGLSGDGPSKIVCSNVHRLRTIVDLVLRFKKTCNPFELGLKSKEQM